MEAALGFERQKQMMGCGDEGCLAQIAGALGAERVVFGDLAQVRELTIFSAQVFNTRTGAVDKRFHERMTGGDAQDLLDATERAAAQLFPETVKSGTATKKKSVFTSATRPLALVLRGGYDVKETGGFGTAMLEYRVGRSVRVGAGPVMAGSTAWGAAVRAAWYPLVFDQLSVYAAAEGHLLFHDETVFAIAAVPGVEWAFSSRFAVSAEIPFVFMASAPAQYRSTYFMPGVAASWRF